MLSDEAVSAAALPEGFTDPASFMYERSDWVMSSNRSDAAQLQRFSFDVGVRRRLSQSDRSVIAVMENLTGSASSIEYFASYKALVRLP